MGTIVRTAGIVVVVAASLGFGACTPGGAGSPTDGVSVSPVASASPAIPPLVWTRSTDPALGGAGEQWLNDVVAAGPGLVAVGADSQPSAVTAGAVWTSADGSAWTRVPSPPVTAGSRCASPLTDGSTDLSVATAGGPGLVALGPGWVPAEDGGECDLVVAWTSSDGLTWQPGHREPLHEWQGTSLWDVAPGGPGFVAVGGSLGTRSWDAAVWTSPDGSAWTRVPDEGSVSGSRGRDVFVHAVTRGGPGVVAVGSEQHQDRCTRAVVWTSRDGLGWTRAPDDAAALRGDCDQGMSSVTSGGPGLVAVGGAAYDPDSSTGWSRAAVWTSPDGVTWTRVPHEDAVFGDADAAPMAMSDVVSLGTMLVATGEAAGRPAAWASLDGATWSRMDLGPLFDPAESVYLSALTAGGPGLVAVGTVDDDALVLTAEATSP